MLGTNGFFTAAQINDFSGFGFNTRMGLELFDTEIGLKTFYGRLSQNQANQYFEQEAYGVSFYTFVLFGHYRKLKFVGHLEGGLSLAYTNYDGSDVMMQMGLGTGIKYALKKYLDLEFLMEYILMSPISSETPSFTGIFVPTIGWSVRI